MGENNSKLSDELYVSRSERIKTDALSPCCMSPDDVDYEMSRGKNREYLTISGMNQESFEYFVQKYGSTYKSLSFFKSQLISDYSLLETLENLESVHIYWNIRAQRLWDISKNKRLKRLGIDECKRIIMNLDTLKTSETLEEINIYGSMFENTPMPSLNGLAGMSALRRIELSSIRLLDKDVSFLDTLPKLEIFDFHAGMLTTEEIAYICAKYPRLKGKSLCAYNRKDATTTDIRICGYRKPGIDLPKGQKRLDRYVAEFEALVEKYRRQI